MDLQRLGLPATSPTPEEGARENTWCPNVEKAVFHWQLAMDQGWKVAFPEPSEETLGPPL